MSVEASQSENNQTNNPVQEARSSFYRILLGKEYNSSALFKGTINLQNALLRSDLTPEKIYHELSIMAGQAAERAEMNQDNETTEALNELQKGFELTYETFRSRPMVAAVRQSHPTSTQSLPPMLNAKGGAQLENRQESTKPQERSFSLFVKQRRDDLKLTQRAIEERAGLPKVTISLIETGNSLPQDEEKIKKLADALELNEEEKEIFMDSYYKQLGKPRRSS